MDIKANNVSGKVRGESYSSTVWSSRFFTDACYSERYQNFYSPAGDTDIPKLRIWLLNDISDNGHREIALRGNLLGVFNQTAISTEYERSPGRRGAYYGPSAAVALFGCCDYELWVP